MSTSPPLHLVLSAALAVSCERGAGDGPAKPSPPDPVPSASAAGGSAPEAPAIPGADACDHPTVTKDCADGWCRIPAGCFILGSPPSEWGRGRYSEDQAAVTLTRSFEIQQTEVTRKQWLDAGLPVPEWILSDIDETCVDDSCPVTGVSWYDAMAFANALSSLHDPPFSPCYVLDKCDGEPARGLRCADVRATTESVYECEGFRLPTSAEWEYAGRAGTRSVYYAGDGVEQSGNETCGPDPVLQQIGWYCQNSGRTPHKVGELLANDWGIYDMSGNMLEWASDRWSGTSPTSPATDPGATFDPGGNRVQRGGSWFLWPSACRSADVAEAPLHYHAPLEGLRLVRTLPE